MTARSSLVARSALVLLGAAVAIAAHASGVAQKLKLADAVARASLLLVVEPADPLTKERTKSHPYVDRKTKARKTLTLRRTLFRFKVTAVIGQTEWAKKTLPTTGSAIEVRDSNAQLGEAVHISMVTTGTWPVPFLPQLEGQARPEKGGRYVLLLGGFDRSERYYLGVGGLGLLPVAQQGEVTRLWQQRAKSRLPAAH